MLPIVLVAIAATVRTALIPILHETPYVIFFPIIIISALYGGLWPGLFATVLSAIAASIPFGPGSLVQVDIPGHAAGIISFLVGNIIIIGIIARLRRTQQQIVTESKRLQQSEQTLKAEVAERKQAEEALRESAERLKRSQEIAHLASWELDLVNNNLTWSDEVYRIFGLQPQEFGATYEAFLERVHPDDRAAVNDAYSGSLREGRDTYEIEHKVIRKATGEIRYVHERCQHFRNESGRIIRSIGMVHDITERKQAEETVRLALGASQQRQAEIFALLQASRAVLEQHEFKDVARNIFDSCKNLIGATAGYVALLSEDGTENEVLFLDSGGLPCTVDLSLPMPIRGLREVAYRTGKAVYENDFSHSKWMKFMPEGHTNLDNVLFAPLVIQDKTLGLLGLGNKPGGFTENDARMASAFGELAAIALHNSRLTEALQKSKDELELKVKERTSELAKTNEELEAEISIRKLAQGALMENSKILETFFTHTINPLVFLDRDFNFIRVNEAYAKACRRDVSEFPGHNHFEFYPHEENKAIFRRVAETKVPYQAVAKPFVFPDHPEWGITYWDWTLVPLLNSKGEVDFLVCSLNDVTERKEAEIHTVINNELLKLFSQTFSRNEYLDSAVALIQEWSGCRCIGIRMLDKNGNIPYESYTGFSKEFWEKENFLSIKNDQCACIRVITEKPDPQDKTVLTPGGSFYSNNTLKFVASLTEGERARFRGTCIRTGFMSVSIIPIRYGEKVMGAIHMADEREGMVPFKIVESVESITPIIGEAIYRFDIEDEVRYSNELLERVFSNIHVMIAYMDPEFNFIRVNRLYAEADGREPEFFIGKNYFDLYHHAENEAIFREVVRTGEPYFAYAKPFEYAEHPERKITYRDWSLQPIKDAAGNVQGLVFSLINVTEKVQLEAEAMHTAHLASLGELAAGVAHEINNPLNGIINYAQMLSNRMKKESRENEIANRIIKEGDRIANIVKSLLSFARKRTEEKNIHHITGILHDALLLSEAQILKDSIKLKVNMPEDLPEIIVNPQQIQQVFLNVLNNSRYALNQKNPAPNEDKILEISGTKIAVDGRQYARIIFYDNGTGISANIIDKVMNPFFSTKPSGKGTGLGLSISHGIIRDHGGNLRIESVEGEFTRIIIDLPSAVKRNRK